VQDETDVWAKNAGSPEEYFNSNFGYDVIRDSVMKVQEVEPAFALPDGFFQKTPGRGMYP
jgi:hypothetical protein